MDKILFADLIFLVLFCLFVIVFLYKNRKNLNREGIIFLYKTSWGMKAMENFAKKNSKLLHRIKYLVIVVAFILMIMIVFLLGTNAYAYFKSPQEIISATNGVAPIVPLIPYFPQVFGMESFFPSFYFSYFIIALAIVAVAHEFAHGIFMRAFGTKIKTTGFLFLGPILGAFVEQEEKSFKNKKNSEQMAILGAGVFTNTLLAILFFFVLILFFTAFYSPSGYVFSNYAQTTINTSNILGFENYSDEFTLIVTEQENYFINNNVYTLLQENQEFLENQILIVYTDSPAIRNNLRGAIIEIDGEKIRNFNSFQEKISGKQSGENITITTNFNQEIKTFNITLDSHPSDNERGFLGVGHMSVVRSDRIVARLVSFLYFKDSNTFYESRFNSDVTDFIYYLIWWTALINLFVALFNMLPFGILDGGRFTYLLILSITKSKSKSQKIYKFISSTVILIFLLIIFGWLFARSL